MKYIIRDREAGNKIATFDTLPEAEQELALYEEEDRKDGTYTADFYEIVEDGPIEERILRTTKMSEHDIQKHLRDGVIYYEDYDQFFTDWLAGLNDEEDAPAAWDKLDTATVDGITYRYEVVL